jgi:hypothetical protein
MLISRRRKEKKTVDIYLNNKHLEQVDKIMYLGIIMDSIFKFNENITYITDRYNKLINTLSKSVRINWGLKHEALRTISNSAVLPQLLYAAPVWIESIKKECNKDKYVRVQIIISLWGLCPPLLPANHTRVNMCINKCKFVYKRH